VSVSNLGTDYYVNDVAIIYFSHCKNRHPFNTLSVCNRINSFIENIIYNCCSPNVYVVNHWRDVALRVYRVYTTPLPCYRYYNIFAVNERVYYVIPTANRSIRFFHIQTVWQSWQLEWFSKRTGVLIIRGVGAVRWEIRRLNKPNVSLEISPLVFRDTPTYAFCTIFFYLHRLRVLRKPCNTRFSVETMCSRPNYSLVGPEHVFFLPETRIASLRFIIILLRFNLLVARRQVQFNEVFSLRYEGFSFPSPG